MNLSERVCRKLGIQPEGFEPAADGEGDPVYRTDAGDRTPYYPPILTSWDAFALAWTCLKKKNYTLMVSYSEVSGEARGSIWKSGACVSAASHADERVAFALAVDAMECQQDRLNEDGICRDCGKDDR